MAAAVARAVSAAAACCCLSSSSARRWSSNKPRPLPANKLLMFSISAMAHYPFGNIFWYVRYLVGFTPLIRLSRALGSLFVVSFASCIRDAP